MALAGLLITLSALSCSSGGGGDDPVDTNDVTLFTAPGAMLALTGLGALDPLHMFATAGGPVIFFDAESGSVLILAVDGTPAIFTSETDITALTGETTVSLGPFDQLIGGTFGDQVVTADATSGLLLRLATNGTPQIHSTEAQMTMATGGASAQAHLPRHLTANQVIAQDAVSKDILLFANTGAATVFVTAADLAAAAGVAEADALIVGWARAPLSGDLFAFFVSTATVVRIQINGTIEAWADATDFAAIFPGFTNIGVVKLTTEPADDTLYILISNNGRGHGIGSVSADGLTILSVSDLADQIGAPSNAIDFGFIEFGGSLFFYGIDGVFASAYTIDSGGILEEAANPGDLLDVTGAPGVNIGPGAPIDNIGVVILEPESDSFVLVR